MPLPTWSIWRSQPGQMSWMRIFESKVSKRYAKNPTPFDFQYIAWIHIPVRTQASDINRKILRIRSRKCQQLSENTPEDALEDN